MGMYSTKNSADDSLSLDTKWLREHNYFCGYKSGGITWTLGFNNKSSISFNVDVMDERPTIRFSYTVTHRRDGEEKYMDYSFSLVKVPCNLGGFRWAFKCSLWVNNRYCGRTVYTLYKANSDYFGCRRCSMIVYESQRKSRSRHELLGKAFDAEKKYEQLYSKIKKWHYQWRPTKKVLQLRRLERQMLTTEQWSDIERNIYGK